MQLGMVVGLGRLGANMASRLLMAGHRVIAHDRDPAPGRALAQEGRATRRLLRAGGGAPGRHPEPRLPAPLLIAMEPVASLGAEAVHDEKVKVLEAIRPMSPDEIFAAPSAASGSDRRRWVVG